MVYARLADVLTRPSLLLLLAAVIGLLLLWAGRRRSARIWLTIGVGGYLCVLVLPVDEWALAPLENRFPQVTAPPAHVDGIIVLGGAVRVGITEAHGIPALNSAAERMTEFVALARRYPDARLAFTGGNASLLPGRLTEADVARMLFDELGVPPQRVVYENRSRNTWENAVYLKRLLGPRPGQTWLLVTTAADMPRAVGVFRRVGWDVLPWPVNYMTGSGTARLELGGLGEDLTQLDWAAHEWVGLLAYRLLGRTETLFPAPHPATTVAAAGPGLVSPGRAVSPP